MDETKSYYDCCESPDIVETKVWYLFDTDMKITCENCGKSQVVDYYEYSER